MSTTSGAKLYRYDGREQTLKAWSAELGIKLSTLYRRLHKGLPISLVLGQSVDASKAGRRHLYTYQGKTATAAEWAKITGLPEATLHYRLTHRKSWSIEKALTTPYSPNTGVHPTSLTLNGETRSVSEWAERLGIREGTLRMRIYRGHNAEAVLNPAVDVSRIRKPLMVTYKGEVHNLTEWSKILGVSTQTLSLRLHSGWSLEDVFERSVVRESVTYEIDGVVKTIAEWAKMSGRSEALVRSRLQLGWGIRRAISEPMHPRGRVAKCIEHQGVAKTIGQWAREFQIPEGVLRNRLAQGWSMDRALTVTKGVSRRKSL